jgi:type I restriction-modification system DNA methylase subunit
LRDCGDSQLGEIITPEAVVGVTNDAMVGTKVEETHRWQTAIDPAAGTGRFLVDLAVRYPNRKIALFGVERNLDLYRACLVNMRLHAWNRPYFALCADSMLVDVQPNSPAWLCAMLDNWPLCSSISRIC